MRLFVLGIALAIGAGCGYSTKSRTAKDIKSIYVPFFINDTNQPNLEITVTERIINNLINDNTLNVVEEGRANAILSGRVSSFKNLPITFDATLNAQEYRVSIDVRVTLARRSPPEPIWKDRTISGQSTYFVEPIPGENTFDTAVEQAIHVITERILNLTVQDW